MLDNVGSTPDPKALAQVRMAFTKKNIPATMADAVLDTVGDAPRAVRLADDVAYVMAQAAAQAPDLTPEQVQGIITDALTNPDATTPQRFAKVALEALAAILAEADRQDPPARGADMRVGRTWEGGHGFRAKMVAGLTAKLTGRADTGMAREAAQMTVGQIAMSCARNAGLRPWNEAEAIQMASHSTSDFPLILSDAMGNTVARRIEQQDPQIARASRMMMRDDYRPSRSLTLSATAMPAEVNEGGQIQYVTADEKGEQNPVIRDFAAGFAITNKALANDATAVGLLNDIGNRMAQGAVERKRAVLLEPLLANAGAGQTMSDGQPMFHPTHGNLAASGAAISVATLTTARTAMRRMRGVRGELLAVTPWALVVPPELETVAQQVLADLAASTVATVNPFSGSLEIIVEAGLTSPTAWYVVADPATYDGHVHAFLDGLTAPRIETRAAWNTLGTEMRLVWALDAKFIETATWYRNPGA